ncbi:MAG: glycosyltransferase, partial [Candidatus Nanopelagicales bacterium]
MRILALPRDPNPYQESLYRAMRRRGARVRYAGRLTPSRSLNILLLPLETAAFRLSGGRVVHLHWVYGFRPGGAGRWPLLARAGRAWFGLWLALCRLLGVRLVWTAHNALPHAPVFPDDAEARRALVRSCDLVIAHAPQALGELAEIGCRPRRSALVPMGPARPPGGPAPRPPVRAEGEPLRLLFFGKVEPYKGVEDLLDALALVPAGADVALTVAGECRDPGLAARLRAGAARAGRPVDLRLAAAPEDEVDALFARHHAVVLPFRRVTTSSSAALALEQARPLVVPDLPGLAVL